MKSECVFGFPTIIILIIIIIIILYFRREGTTYILSIVKRKKIGMKCITPQPIFGIIQKWYRCQC